MQTLLGVFVLLVSGIAFPQIKNAKSPDLAADPSDENHRSITPIIDPCRARGGGEAAEILTDTMGVDFRPYLTGVTNAVRQSWYAVMPPSAYPPMRKQGKVSIEFLINKNGEVGSMKMQTSSSDVALDRAAWGSIAGSGPFGRLPAEFPGQQIRLLVHFYYNLEKSSISISPCIDVKVPAGSTVQFSASLEETADKSVNWNLSGSGCSELACGTISKNGLYTAPVDIPSPPTIVVEAKLPSGYSGKAKLTVVQPTPH
jgi:TonB family protein